MMVLMNLQGCKETMLQIFIIKWIKDLYLKYCNAYRIWKRCPPCGLLQCWERRQTGWPGLWGRPCVLDGTERWGGKQHIKLNWKTNQFVDSSSQLPEPEQGFCVVYDALVGVVVGVGEEDVPVLRQWGGVYSKAVILAGDEAAICRLVYARLVVTTVPVPESGEKLQLVGPIDLDGISNICAHNTFLVNLSTAETWRSTSFKYNVMISLIPLEWHHQMHSPAGQGRQCLTTVTFTLSLIKFPMSLRGKDPPPHRCDCGGSNLVSLVCSVFFTSGTDYTAPLRSCRRSQTAEISKALEFTPPRSQSCCWHECSSYTTSAELPWLGSLRA